MHNSRAIPEFVIAIMYTGIPDMLVEIIAGT